MPMYRIKLVNNKYRQIRSGNSEVSCTTKLLTYNITIVKTLKYRTHLRPLDGIQDSMPK